MSINNLKAYHVHRAKARTHRPCPTHGPIRYVCDTCIKVVCPKCEPHVCAPQATRIEVIPSKTPTAYKAPRGLTEVWHVLQPLGALDIFAHPDADAWMVRFPPAAMNAESAGDLANRLWAMPTFLALADTTAFRAGRGNKPTHWWVSFRLKEPIHVETESDTHIGGQTEVVGDSHEDVSEE